jgi:hypothetical protein
VRRISVDMGCGSPGLPPPRHRLRQSRKPPPRSLCMIASWTGQRNKCVREVHRYKIWSRCGQAPNPAAERRNVCGTRSAPPLKTRGFQWICRAQTMLQRAIKCWTCRLQTITLLRPDRLGTPDVQVLVSTRVFPGHASANRVIMACQVRRRAHR